MDLEDIVWKRLDLMCDDKDLEPFSKALPLRSWPGDLGRSKSSASAISLHCMRRKVDLNAYRCAPPISDYAVSAEAEESEDQRHSNYGVFPLASLFNHSCAPNMCKVLLADWVFLRAARDIEPGEELTQFYCDIRMPVAMRQKELVDLFGFSCSCARCRFELLLESGDVALDQWRSLYSCEVPLMHQRFAAEMQGVVLNAETAVMSALKQMESQVTDQDQKISGESWALWPLIPAFQQLAIRLRLDGRFEESLEIFRRADAVVRSVVPLSNIHLRLHTEMLMTSSTEDLLLENFWLVAAGFGAGLQVWQMLVGFRLSRNLRQRVESLRAPPVGCGCNIHYRWEEVEKRKILTAWCAAFRSSHDIVLDASDDMLILNAPDAVELKVSCSKVDVATMETKFSRKRRCLTPQKGGALHGEDAFSYSHLLERFESDRKDFHPLNPRERSTAADMCRYMDQRLQAQGFASISAALEGEVIRADQLLDHLQLFLPTPMRPEDLKVAENLLRLGRPLSDGGIDVVEFCQRFELLARNGAAAASAPPAPVKPPPIPDTDVSKIMLRERPCPVDLNALGLQRMAEVALRLQREFPDGTAALYRLVRALEAETKALPSARQQDQLKRWLEAAPGDTLRWPMMLGFEVIVEKLTIMATKELRKSYSQFQLGISFCGRDLKSRRVPWRMGLMCLSKPSTMEMQPKWHVIFAIDGPDGLTSRELSLALSETPEPPPSHRLRFILYGIRAGSTGGVQEEVRELGCCELCAGYDLPSSDLRPSDPRAQRIIEVSATEAELAAGALSPALRATLQLSTKRAGRLREVAGIRSEEELHARG
eukprot:symbB.v1.2.002179.t1/scaffold112.1/size324616/7